MKLTKANIKKVLEDNFSEYINMELVGITKDRDSNDFNVLSKPQGLNADVHDSPSWDDSLIAHIKWQLYI